MTKSAIDNLSYKIIGAAIEVHKHLGPAKGILINFNCTNIFREGQKALVNDLYQKLPS